MVKVKIVDGVYGYKPKGARSVQIVRYGEVVDVSKTEAKRLQGLKVAVECEEEKTQEPPPEEPPENTDNSEQPPSAADPVVE